MSRLRGLASRGLTHRGGDAPRGLCKRGDIGLPGCGLLQRGLLHRSGDAPRGLATRLVGTAASLGAADTSSTALGIAMSGTCTPGEMAGMAKRMARAVCSRSAWWVYDLAVVQL